jgi:hypothetical protein
VEPRDARAPPARLTRRILVVTLVVLPVMGALVARPRRYEVDGHSMGPALRPGDLVATGWLPFRDHWHRPGRFERWVVALPDGTAGLKRIVGLPGETVAVIDGDLHVGGDAVLKPPAILAQVASPVGPRCGLGAGDTAWSLPPAPILDDDPDEPDGPTRLLLPVRDAGFAGIVHVEAVGDARVRARVGPFAVTWRLESVGRHAVVAGRLDGHVVAAAWLVPPGDAWDGRSCLPAAAPARWDVTRPWPGSLPDAGATAAPSLGLALVATDVPGAAAIGDVAVWRDVLYRPTVAGDARWSLTGDAHLVLGDRPVTSRDSRHFGPLPRAALRHRVHGPVSP